MSVFISGGCRNGKSTWALRFAAAGPKPLYYVATMIPRDGEDRARVKRHQMERAGMGFETIERQKDIGGLAIAPGGTALLEDLVSILKKLYTDAVAFPL